MKDKPLISFDYAIKCLLRDKGDYDIVEGFISALLSTIGYQPVKISALLESESNKEEKALKKSVADLIVEDTNGVKYIVEIERSYSHFIEKACFNTSRLLVDTIKSSQQYMNISKVFHISLLYAPPKTMTKPIYCGKTIIHDVDAVPINMTIKDHGVIFEANILPEYLFISIPCFNDVVKKEVDEWLYVLKNSDTKADFKSPYMTKVREKLNVFRMSKEEQQAYIDYLNEIVKAEDALDIAETKGFDKGKAEGEATNTIKIAKNMLAEKIDLKVVSKVTGLSETEIQNLKS